MNAVSRAYWQGTVPAAQPTADGLHIPTLLGGGGDASVRLWQGKPARSRAAALDIARAERAIRMGLAGAPVPPVDWSKTIAFVRRLPHGRFGPALMGPAQNWVWSGASVFDRGVALDIARAERRARVGEAGLPDWKEAVPGVVAVAGTPDKFHGTLHAPKTPWTEYWSCSHYHAYVAEAEGCAVRKKHAETAKGNVTPSGATMPDQAGRNVTPESGDEFRPGSLGPYYNAGNVTASSHGVFNIVKSNVTVPQGEISWPGGNVTVVRLPLPDGARVSTKVGDGWVELVITPRKGDKEN